MVWPPRPPELRDVEAYDFRALASHRAHLRVGALGAALLVGLSVAWPHWGGHLVVVSAAAVAAAGWCAGAMAQRLCLRRDHAVLVTVAECRVEPGDRGPLAVWELAPPVLPRLARRRLRAAWAAGAKPGATLPARVRESGYGTFELVLGEPRGAEWWLPTEVGPWPLAAQVYVLVAAAAVLWVTLLALAPSLDSEGEIVAAAQRPWTDRLGRTPWDLVIVTCGESVPVTLSHRQFLRLLPPAGRRALAAPGLLPEAQRPLLLERYRPVRRPVRMRRTELGPWQTTFYVGP